MRRLATLTLGLLLFLAACDARGQTPPAALHAASLAQNYPFITTTDTQRLDASFHVPDGFTRVEVDEGSFGEWLRGLPIVRGRKTVRSYTGRKLNSPSAGIVAIDVGDRNLQQCADSAIRLHAEWLWSQGRKDALAYHFTSGDEVTYRDWVRGERIRAVGSKVTRSRGARRADDHDSLRDWLDLVFMYAGTQSLHRDSTAVGPADVRPGDFYVAPGAPGHAVIVLDVAEHSDGRRAALLGQGFMPAQELHVIRDGGRHVIDGTWFLLPDDSADTLRTPSWTPFSADSVRRFSAR